MELAPHVQALIDQCKEAQKEGNFQLIEAKLENLLQILDDSSLWGASAKNLEEIARILESIEEYSHARKFYQNFYDFKIKYPGSGLPFNVQEILRADYEKQKNGIFDELNFKSHHRSEYNYCGFDSKQLNKPIALKDGVCPISNQRLKNAEASGTNFKWVFREISDCIAINGLMIQPMAPSNFEVFRGSEWNLRLQVEQNNRSLTEIRQHAPSLNLVHEGGYDQYRYLREKGKDIALFKIRPAASYIVDLLFEVKRDELDTQKQYSVENFLKIEYKSKSWKNPPDLLRNLIITVYPPLAGINNLLRVFLRNYAGQTVHFDDDEVLSNFNNDASIVSLSESAFWVCLKSNLSGIKYRFNEQTREFTILESLPATPKAPIDRTQPPQSTLPLPTSVSEIQEVTITHPSPNSTPIQELEEIRGGEEARHYIFFSYADADFKQFQISEVSALLLQKGGEEFDRIYYWNMEKPNWNNITEYEEKGIQNSDVVIVFFAEDSKDAEGVVDELRIAKTHNKPIIPVYLKDPRDIWDADLRDNKVIGVQFGKDLRKFIEMLYLTIKNRIKAG